MIEPGTKAPDFEGETQSGDTIRLSDFAGRKVAVYFYPKDDTSGCTKQACNLRDNWEALQEAGVAVIGISKDSAKSHEKFASKYSLPFPLIADTEKEIIEAFGAWGQKSLYGRKYLGIFRTTFLIDEQGIVIGVIRKPKVSGHAEEILEAFGLAQ